MKIYSAGWVSFLKGLAGAQVDSASIAAGYRPRLCAALFCIGFTYVELIDRATCLNHYYLMSLVSLLLAILPAHRGIVRGPVRRSGTI